ncbi:MAG: radical SAM protein [Acidobacteria bacterium]|nr:radical SAM protein [Acidobacteriota bacterium]
MSAVQASLEITTPARDGSNQIHSLPVLVLLPHNRCNCRCVMCDIWRIRQVREITASDLEGHRTSLRTLQVRWVVLSGGEPLMHSDLGALGRFFHEEGIRVTLLTAGLILERYARMVAENVDDVIVSLDGPSEVHDSIRGIPRAFERLARGIEAVRKIRPVMPISARCTIQKGNHLHLQATLQAARRLGLNSISFLAADVNSTAFNRPEGWTSDRQATVALDANEVEELSREIGSLLENYAQAVESGFVVETAEKLRRVEKHFRARLGQLEAAAPLCNAPWVSAVIEADGNVRPCFFHPSLGSIHEGNLHSILNSQQAIGFRASLDIATNPVCRRCTCSLNLNSHDGQP